MRHVCDKCGKQIDSLGPCAACQRKLDTSPLATLWLILVFIVIAVVGAVLRWFFRKIGLDDLFTA
jgi:hypothetical protein